MNKIRIVLMLATIFSTQQVFANDVSDMSADSSSKPCAVIANACSAAGFVRTETSGKRFWQDCMKPIILGKTVSGVTVDTASVKACRVNKIEELKSELKEIQKSMSKSS